MPDFTTQNNWRWCSQCEGLWYAGNGTRGRCHGGTGEHSQAGSGNYSLVFQEPTHPGQHGWRHCSKCQGLWFSGSTDRSWCPEELSFGHLSSGSDYSLVNQNPAAPGQHGWRWCKQCQGLWFAGHPSSRGRCPKFGAPHSLDGSGDYALTQVV